MRVNPRPPAVLADGVSKTFRIPREHVHTLKEKALHPFRRPGHDELRALRDVSFAVQPGEFFGIVGRNGSGKSTLLKCLAGIYAVDRGRIYVNGRVSTFIELGVGFNPDLPARDNVMINATMLGLPPREARNRFDQIIDFAELHEFVDLKLKNYSSGMLVRLAFSVMIQVDAEILLIDEVLAVGDAAFQQKCYDEFARIRSSGATVLLVTHDMNAVQRFCDRAMLLEHGRCAEMGDTERVADRYVQLNFSEDARAAEAQQAAQADAAAGAASPRPAPAGAGSAGQGDREPADGEAGSLRLGDGRAEILEGWFEDEHGERATLVPSGRRCAFAARVRFNERVEDPLFGINLHNAAGEMLWAASNALREKSGTFDPGDEVTFRIRFDNVLAPDRYFATPAVARGTGGLAWLDRRSRLASVMVTGTRAADGVVDLPFEMEIERAATGERTEVAG
jgi:ABC-type polysaccharide/polyol phosphate transport system ATPase subunit